MLKMKLKNSAFEITAEDDKVIIKSIKKSSNVTKMSMMIYKKPEELEEKEIYKKLIENLKDFFKEMFETKEDNEEEEEINNKSKVEETTKEEKKIEVPEKTEEKKIEVPEKTEEEKNKINNDTQVVYNKQLKILLRIKDAVEIFSQNQRGSLIPSKGKVIFGYFWDFARSDMKPSKKEDVINAVKKFFGEKMPTYQKIVLKRIENVFSANRKPITSNSERLPNIYFNAFKVEETGNIFFHINRFNSLVGRYNSSDRERLLKFKRVLWFDIPEGYKEPSGQEERKILQGKIKINMKSYEEDKRMESREKNIENPMAEETKKKISEAKKGQNSYVLYVKLKNMKTGEIKEFKRAKEAAEFIGLNSNCFTYRKKNNIKTPLKDRKGNLWEILSLEEKPTSLMRKIEKKLERQ